MRIKNKKATHVGVILSFVIFITFVVFLIVILRPTSNLHNNEKATIELLKKNIQNFVSAEITSFILTPSDTPSNCFNLNDSGYDLSEFNVSARNQENTVLNTDRDSNALYIEKTASDQIYKVDYSPSYLNTNSFSNPNNCKDLDVKSIKKTDQILEPLINELILKQENNYSGLKNDFNMPSEKEFGIMFEFENTTTIGKSIPEKRKATYVKKFQVIYLDLNANERIGNFMIYIV